MFSTLCDWRFANRWLVLFIPVSLFVVYNYFLKNKSL